MIMMAFRELQVSYLIFCITTAVFFSPDLGYSLSPQNSSQSADPQQSDSTSAAIKRWVAELHADRSLVRQKASRQLVEAGSESIGALVEAIEKGNQDEQMRIMSVLHQLAISRDQNISESARESMRVLAKTGNGSARGLAINALTRLGAGMEDSAVKNLSTLGAKIGSRFVSNVREYNITIDDAWKGSPSDLELLLWIENTRAITLLGGQIEDSVIETVSLLPRLKFLNIKDASITNKSFEHLSKMNELVELQVLFCNVDDGCKSDVEKFTNLRELKLWGTNVTSQAGEQLRGKVNFIVDVRRGAFLGVNYDPENREQLTVTNVRSGTSAERAGVRRGDVIIRYGDKVINGPDDFRGTVSENRPGDVVDIVIVRDGEQITKSVKLGQLKLNN